MFELRRAEDRGTANFGWLDSKHTFSFGSYYDANHMGFSALRVINDDTVAGGAGFATHGHKDMEIISYVTHGTIEHKDSMDNVQVLPAGEFQLMSAGTGVYHSEYNGSQQEELKFLQIWIQPNQLGIAPGYQQKRFDAQPGLTKIITADGRDGTLKIHQNAELDQLLLAPEQQLDLGLDLDRKTYIHLIEGQLSVNDCNMQAGDGLKVQKENALKLLNTGETTVTALVFDLPA